jgi:hypothetical protein
MVKVLSPVGCVQGYVWVWDLTEKGGGRKIRADESGGVEWGGGGVGFQGRWVWSLVVFRSCLRTE